MTASLSSLKYRSTSENPSTSLKEIFRSALWLRPDSNHLLIGRRKSRSSLSATEAPSSFIASAEEVCDRTRLCQRSGCGPSAERRPKVKVIKSAVNFTKVSLPESMEVRLHSETLQTKW